MFLHSYFYSWRKHIKWENSSTLSLELFNKPTCNIAYVNANLGDADSAFEWLDIAVRNKDGGLSEILGEPLFANLHDDPRWLPFLQKINYSPEQLAAIEFDVGLAAKAARQSRR